MTAGLWMRKGQAKSDRLSPAQEKALLLRELRGGKGKAFGAGQPRHDGFREWKGNLSVLGPMTTKTRGSPNRFAHRAAFWQMPLPSGLFPQSCQTAAI